MKVLLDSCVWGGAKETIEKAGHNVIWTGALTQDPGDEAILNIAYREKRVLLLWIKILENLPLYITGPIMAL